MWEVSGEWPNVLSYGDHSVSQPIPMQRRPPGSTRGDAVGAVNGEMIVNTDATGVDGVVGVGGVGGVEVASSVNGGLLSPKSAEKLFNYILEDNSPSVKEIESRMKSVKLQSSLATATNSNNTGAKEKTNEQGSHQSVDDDKKEQVSSSARLSKASDNDSNGTTVNISPSGESTVNLDTGSASSNSLSTGGTIGNSGVSPAANEDLNHQQQSQPFLQQGQVMSDTSGQPQQPSQAQQPLQQQFIQMPQGIHAGAQYDSTGLATNNDPAGSGDTSTANGMQFADYTVMAAAAVANNQLMQIDSSNPAAVAAALVSQQSYNDLLRNSAGNTSQVCTLKHGQRF